MDLNDFIRISRIFYFPFIIKLLRFGAVGISGMVIDFGVTSFIKEVLKGRRYLANSIGFILAATSNFILNRIWTFNSASPDIILQFSKFLTISAMGLLLNNLIVYVFSDYKFKINFYISKAIATILIFFWNFFMNYFFTFWISAN
jgi:putative flippase GtrA